MAECHHAHEHHHHHAAAGDHGKIVSDQVCGMKVDTTTAQHKIELGDGAYYFCSARCLEKFRANPDAYLNPTDNVSQVSAPAGTIWTCPMHPEIRRDGPGSCPICGMALEPLEPSLEEGPNPELIEMTRRFWVSTAFTVPLAVLVVAPIAIWWTRYQAKAGAFVQYGYLVLFALAVGSTALIASLTP